MTCENKPGIIICSAPWGLGTYQEPEDEYPTYGMSSPNWMNPYWFMSDPDCCTEKEREALKKAREEWTGER